MLVVKIGGAKPKRTKLKKEEKGEKNCMVKREMIE